MTVTKQTVKIIYPDGTTKIEERLVEKPDASVAGTVAASGGDLHDQLPPPEAANTATTTTMVSNNTEAVLPISTVPAATGEDLTTLSSANSSAAKAKDDKNNPRKKMIVIAVVAGILVFGGIIGLVVGLIGKDKSRSSDGILVTKPASGSGNSNSNSNSNNQGSNESKPKPNPSPEESSEDQSFVVGPCTGEIVRYQLNDIFFSPFPSETVLHLPLLEESACIDACLAVGATSGYFSNFNEGESCQCYDSSKFNCLARWGESYNADSYYSDIASGTVFTKECFDVCDYEFCDFDSNFAGCFTGHQYDLQTYMFWGPDVQSVPAATVDTYSTTDCLDFCKTYYAAFHSTNVGSEFCRCYEESQIFCLMPWGDEVDPDQHIASGTLFTKESMYECTTEYCDEHPDHWYCYSGSKMSRKDFNFYGGELLTSAEDIYSEGDCLKLCADVTADAVYFNSWYDTCYCYNSISCLAPTGSDAVDKDFYGIQYGYIYVKDLATSICSQDWCDLDVNNPYCLTGSKTKREEINPYGTSLNETYMGEDLTEWECLTLCSEFEAAYYNTWYDTCYCYNGVDCMAPTGSAVNMDFYGIKYGYIYYKDPPAMKTCSGDWCDMNDDNGYCLSGSKVTSESFLLYGEALVRTASSIDDDFSEWECLQYCSSYQGAYYNTWYDACYCFDEIDCLAPTGEEINTDLYAYSYGYVYVKDTNMGTCASNWCDLMENDPDCFTGSKVSREEYNLHGANMVETVTGSDLTESECLILCQASDGAMYNTYYDTCSCFDGIDCLAPTGPAVDVDSYQISRGYVYVKDINMGICTANWCDLNDSNPNCFTGSKVSRTISHLYGVNLEPTLTGADMTEWECLTLCQDSDGASYNSYYDSCSCFDNVECLADTGTTAIDLDLYTIKYGYSYVKDPTLSSCGTSEWCDLDSNNFYCLTGSKVSRRSFNLYGEGMIQTMTATDVSEMQCLVMCATEDGGYYDSWYDTCECYRQLDCLAPTDPAAVNINDYRVNYGYTFAKPAVAASQCASNWCTLNDDNPLCLTGYEESRRDYNLYGANMVQTLTGEEMSEWECLTMCAESDGAYYNSWYDTCECYDNIDCLASTGDNIDITQYRINYGYTFVKPTIGALPKCASDWCSLNEENPFCLQGTKVPRSDFSLYGTNMIETLSGSASTEWECMTMCFASDGALFNSYDDTCQCYDNVDCLATTDFTTSISYWDYIYVRPSLSSTTCSSSICTLDPTNSLCSE